MTAKTKGGICKAIILSFLIGYVLSFLSQLNGVRVTSAQQASAPLVLNIKGDLWAWTAPGKALLKQTNWGYNKEPVLSPLGKQVAYKSTATVAVNAIKRSGGIGGGDLPANIWVMDVVSTNAIRVADQPPDATLLEPNKPDKHIVRSRPAWSPDGTELAWTELIQDGKTQSQLKLQLVIYSLDQKETRVIVPNLPPQYGIPAALDIAWGGPGIAVVSTAEGKDAQGYASPDGSILIYDTTGKLLSSAKIGIFADFAWVKDQDKDYVAVLSTGPTDRPGDPQWLMVEPGTGKVVTMPGVPELYSLNMPDSVTLFPVLAGATPEWQIALPGKPIAKLGNIDDVYVFPSALSIAPDGKQVAYVKQGQAFVFADGQVTKVGTSDVNSLAWGPTAWRVRRQKAK